MEPEQRHEFDAQLDAIRYAEEYALKERLQRQELARLNAHLNSE